MVPCVHGGGEGAAEAGKGDGGAFEEGNLPSEGLTYCIPYAGGSDKCCASDDTTSVVAN